MWIICQTSSRYILLLQNFNKLVDIAIKIIFYTPILRLASIKLSKSPSNTA